MFNEERFTFPPTPFINPVTSCDLSAKRIKHSRRVNVKLRLFAVLFISILDRRVPPSYLPPPTGGTLTNPPPPQCRDDRLGFVSTFDIRSVTSFRNVFYHIVNIFMIRNILISLFRCTFFTYY